MNVLIDAMPTQIDGIPIYTDFRNMIKLEQLYKEAEVWDVQKAAAALGLLYAEPPQDIQKGIENLFWFHRRGETPEEDRERKTQEAYDFDFDADDIAAAFLSSYGMRLVTLPANSLHWWEFCALFNGLPNDTLIKEKMYYRTVDLSKISSRHEKSRVQKLKKAFAIKREKHKYTLKEIEAMTIAHYNKGKGQQL